MMNEVETAFETMEKTVQELKEKPSVDYEDRINKLEKSKDGLFKGYAKFLDMVYGTKEKGSEERVGGLKDRILEFQNYNIENDKKVEKLEEKISELEEKIEQGFSSQPQSVSDTGYESVIESDLDDLNNFDDLEDLDDLPFEELVSEGLDDVPFGDAPQDLETGPVVKYKTIENLIEGKKRVALYRQDQSANNWKRTKVWQPGIPHYLKVFSDQQLPKNNVEGRIQIQFADMKTDEINPSRTLTLNAKLNSIDPTIYAQEKLDGFYTVVNSMGTMRIPEGYKPVEVIVTYIKKVKETVEE